MSDEVEKRYKLTLELISKGYLPETIPGEVERLLEYVYAGRSVGDSECGK